MTEAPTTNFRVLQPSRKKVREGDVFVVQLPDDLYLYGRVVSLDADLVYMTKVVLLYFFQQRYAHKLPVPWDALTPANLLIPPVLTNKQGWYRGVFETVDHKEIAASERLTTHCFYSPLRNRYFDDRNNELSGPIGPVGDYSLASYRTIDDRISDALGISRAP